MGMDGGYAYTNEMVRRCMQTSLGIYFQSDADRKQRMGELAKKVKRSHATDDANRIPLETMQYTLQQKAAGFVYNVTTKQVWLLSRVDAAEDFEPNPDCQVFVWDPSGEPPPRENVSQAPKHDSHCCLML